MATKKTPAAKGSRSRAAAPKSADAELHARKQASAIVLFAVGMLVGALTIIEGDSAWKTLHDTLFGLFGIAAWFIAPLLIYTAIMTTLDKPIGAIGSKIWQTASLIVLIASALQIFHGPLVEEGLWNQTVELFQLGIALEGGGLSSAVVGLPLLAIFGESGAKFVIVLLIFVFVMIFSGATLIGLYRAATQPVKKMSETYSQRVQERAQAEPPPPRPARQAPARQPPAAAPPPLPAAGSGRRFNVDVPLGGDTPEFASGDAPDPGHGQTAQPEPSDPFSGIYTDRYSDSLYDSVPQGSFARKSLDNPVDAARDALFSAAHPAGRFEFDFTPVPPGPVRSDGLPLGPDEIARRQLEEDARDGGGTPSGGEYPDPLAEIGADTVLRFRAAPAATAQRPQSTDEVIDEILRRALGEPDEGELPDLAPPSGGPEERREDGPAFGDPAPPAPPCPSPGGGGGTELFGNPQDAIDRKLMDGIDAALSESRAAPDRAARTADPSGPAGLAPPMAPPDGGAPEPPPYAYPPLTLLGEVRQKQNDESAEELKANAQRLVDTLQSFGVQTRVVDIARGPAVTRYELQPSAGVKISKITSLADDIALNLAAAGVRIEAPIPNKPAVGIEVPNKNVSVVQIREIIDSDEFRGAKSALTIALGRDISGHITVADAAKMPHMLIAGSTGSGKSVCINSIIISLLYKSPPDKVKLLMVDPKVVELGIYNGVPHLLVPVVTDPKKAAGALAWAVTEMLGRYKQFADNAVRDIAGFNRLCPSHPELVPMPHIVIIIDELADLMMAAPNDVEDYICRLAQMARAAGMHLIIATQRPSVDVITGVIKANIPSRIAFAVSSSIDSRTILDSSGAEKLLGRGDMLFYPVGAAKPQRVQGCFVTDQEVESVVGFIKRGAEQAQYDLGIMEEIERQAVTDKKKGGQPADDGGGFDDEDDMLPAAIECVVEMGMASTSMLQRKLKLGYARAARIVDQLEDKGIVGPLEGSKPRQVLMSREQYYEMKMNNES